jgi:DNA-binding NarL/FixJ family response regulator
MGTRILVADDHDVVRQGVRALLEGQPGWEVCGEAVDGRQAVEQARRLKPDLVVLDIGMPEMNGLEAARRILESRPQTEVLILTMHDSEQLIREVVRAGARGYVLKSDAGRTLVAAVQALREHKPFLTARVSEIVLEAYREGSAAPADEHITGSDLTPRELEIVKLIAEGRSGPQVAAVLGISVKTVETHRTNVMRKLDLHSVTELVRYAIRNNLVAP